MSKVYVVGVHHPIRKMYLEEGWEVVTSPYDADFVHLGGTIPPDPTFYGEAKRSPLDITDPALDAYELNTFHSLKHEVHFVGTGRGAWLLGVALFRDLRCNDYSPELFHVDLSYDEWEKQGSFLINPRVSLLYGEKGKRGFTDVDILVYSDAYWGDGEVILHKSSTDARKKHLLYSPFPELDEKESNTRRAFFKYVEEEILNG